VDTNESEYKIVTAKGIAVIITLMKSSLVSLLMWKSKSKINTKVKDIQNNTTIFIIDIIILFFIA